MSTYGRINLSLMNFQIIRVISSPSISTRGVVALMRAMSALGERERQNLAERRKGEEGTQLVVSSSPRPASLFPLAYFLITSNDTCRFCPSAASALVSAIG